VRIDEYAIPVITRRRQPRRRPGPGIRLQLHRKRRSNALPVVPIWSRESPASATLLHEDRAFFVQTRPYALEASFHVRSLRSSRRVRVASRMTAIDPNLPFAYLASCKHRGHNSLALAAYSITSSAGWTGSWVRIVDDRALRRSIEGAVCVANYFARIRVDTADPPTEVAGVLYFSSSPLTSTSRL
jgi:hypothetical protein